MSAHRLAAALALCWAMAPSAAAGPPPAEAFVLHCAGCHRLDGSGVPGLAPSLHDLAKLAALPEGRAYLVRVPGVAQAPLPDDELAALLNWIVTELGDASGFDRYRAAEVSEWRAQPLRDPLKARPAPDARSER